MRQILVILVLLLTPIPAMADDSAANYGDGLRHYAEGRYNLALENLYRAYAEKPSANLMKLIIRSHDFMGHCSAVERQMLMFRESYPREDAPKPQLCATPGTLKIECSPHAQIIIDHMITADCGTELKLPPGTHRVHSTQLNEVAEFKVTAGQTTTATLQLNPEKWMPNRSQNVPLLNDPQQYTVIKSADGLYEIWVRSNLRDDPDMNRLQLPGFTILRSTDGLYDISSDALKEPYPVVKPKERRAMPSVPIAP